MKTTQNTQASTTTEQQVDGILKQPVSSKIQPPIKKPLTFGQKVADKMAAKVGSWAFLIGQSSVLVGWITFNSVPGLPHFDSQPFILLNLMFSFASAYTAPVVLMSQNRQSEEDRESANHNYQITLQAAQQLELLHEKLDAQYSAKLDQLTDLIKQQQAADNVKVVFVPSQSTHHFDHQSNTIADIPVLNTQLKNTVFVTIPEESADTSNLNLDNVQVSIRN